MCVSASAKDNIIAAKFIIGIFQLKNKLASRAIKNPPGLLFATAGEVLQFANEHSTDRMPSTVPACFSCGRRGIKKNARICHWRAKIYINCHALWTLINRWSRCKIAFSCPHSSVSPFCYHLGRVFFSSHNIFLRCQLSVVFSCLKRYLLGLFA